MGVCVAAFYYVMNLRVQQNNMKATLQTRQADILQRHAQITASQDWADSWHDVYYNQNFLTFEEWGQKYGVEHPEHYTRFIAIIQYYEILGGLLRDELVGIEVVERVQQPIHLICVWERVKPVILGFRKRYGDDNIYRNMEYLYDRMMERHPESKRTLEVVKENYSQRHLRD